MLDSFTSCRLLAVCSRQRGVCRRDELAIGLTTAEGAKALLEKYTKEAVEAAMQAYVLEGRQAMGPSYLKVEHTHVHEGELSCALATDKHACARRGPLVVDIVSK